jgi:hypothetical protein
MATARDRHYYTRPARSIVVVTLAVTMLMRGHHAHAWSPCSCMVTMLMCGHHAAIAKDVR